MANYNSTTVTNLIATPSVVGASSFMYGKVRVYQEYQAIAGTGSTGANGDTFVYFPISLDSCILNMEVKNPAMTAATDYDFGFYKIAGDGTLGAALDADAILDGGSLTSARAAWTSVLPAAAGKVVADINQKIWQDMGYASITAAREAAGRNEVYFVVTATAIGSTDGHLAIRLTVGVE